uniref:F-box associated beta-propeller type 3 domain-containing protein n=1 Tax=Aegilops tauschii subsp. strangulata TaxID=200361 RepID=A0A453ST11_AEGTS
MIRRLSVSWRLPKYRREGAFDSCYSSQVNHRGSLHWLTGIYTETAVDIMVFDTVTETFWWMRSPDQLGQRLSLLEMDGKLASCSKNDAYIEIWVMQDYKAEAWALKYRINLLAMKTSPLFDYISKMALLNQRELLICCHNPLDSPDYLLHCDIDGKFLGYYEIKGGTYSVYFTNQYFQESMIPLPYGEVQEEGGLDEEPSFFIGL